MATWIRKDTESDQLTSYRPIMQSSVVAKWLERLCLGPRPELSLLHRAPLWGFRPGLSASMLALTVQFVLHGMLTWSSARMGVDAGSRGDAAVPGYLLFIDVEKAFDCMRLPCQLEALHAAGIHPDRTAAYLCEMLHSSVWVRLGDTEVGPLKHARGKQGGCATPFVFNAMMALALEECFATWRRNKWGIQVLSVHSEPEYFRAGLFADNLVLAGTYAQVIAMYSDITRAISRLHFRWKPSSFAALGPPDSVLALPAVGTQVAREVNCKQVLPWLGRVLSYNEGWDASYERAFSAATSAWNANRKVLYNRRLSLRCRLTVFSQTVTSVLLTQLSELPVNPRVLQRVRRLESRYLRALIGNQRPAESVNAFADLTRHSRKVAAAAGHSDWATSLLERVHSIVGKWTRTRHARYDLAAQDFQRAWASGLTHCWEHMLGHGAARLRPGRPVLAWDSLFSQWSSGCWRRWAACPVTWAELAPEWLKWARRQCGLADVEARSVRPSGEALTVRHPSPDVIVRALPTMASMSPECPQVRLHLHTDSMIVARTMQGRWTAKQPWLVTLVKLVNSVMANVPGLSGVSPEGWWISHTPRTSNAAADFFAKLARDHMHLLSSLQSISVPYVSGELSTEVPPAATVELRASRGKVPEPMGPAVACEKALPDASCHVTGQKDASSHETAQSSYAAAKQAASSVPPHEGAPLRGEPVALSASPCDPSGQTPVSSSMYSSIIFVCAPSAWASWQQQGPQAPGLWRLTLDGSTVPVPGYSRGASGCAALLWRTCQGRPAQLVAVALASSSWSTAVSAEAAALQLATGLLHAIIPLSRATAGILQSPPALSDVLTVGDDIPWFDANVLPCLLSRAVQFESAFALLARLRDVGLVAAHFNVESSPTDGSLFECIACTAAH